MLTYKIIVQKAVIIVSPEEVKVKRRVFTESEKINKMDVLELFCSIHLQEFLAKCANDDRQKNLCDNSNNDYRNENNYALPVNEPISNKICKIDTFS